MPRELAFDDVKIRSANPTRLHADEDVAAVGLGRRHVAQFERRTVDRGG
jgi:hypothetical protein